MIRKWHSVGDLRPTVEETPAPLPSTLPSTPEVIHWLDALENAEYQVPQCFNGSPKSPPYPSIFSVSQAADRQNYAEYTGKDVRKPSSKIPKGLTIPLSKRPFPRKESSFFDRRRGGVSHARVNHSRMTSPDRFVPSREIDSPPETQYRVILSPRLRSFREKASQRRNPTADPFFRPASARTVNDPVLLSPADPRFTPHHRPRHVDDHGVADYLRAHGHDPEDSDDNPEETQRPNGVGAVWHIGGGAPALGGTSTGAIVGTDRPSRTGTVAPRYTAKFERKETDAEQQVIHEARVALALDLHPSSRVLGFSIPCTPPDTPSSIGSPVRTRPPLTWKDSAWTRDVNYPPALLKTAAKETGPPVPTVPFRILDAPFLRNDFYSTTLAYCHTAQILAVGLSSRVYLWSEQAGVRSPPLQQGSRDNYVTSLSFSSKKGGHSILAIGRRYGQLCLWSTFDRDARFNETFPVGVACVSFKDTPTLQSSEWFPRMSVTVEHLAVGDDAGNIWYYIIEWTNPKLKKRYGWNGSITLVARIAAHTLQVCGLAWSPDGRYFATGGNDNVCLVFDTEDIFSGVSLREREGAAKERAAARRRLRRSNHNLPQSHRNDRPVSLISTSTVKNGVRDTDVSESDDGASEASQETIVIHPGQGKHRLKHHAAVKAIAFAPWQPTLLATGGGTNDRCIRFWHTPTGALLATIKVYAQVTSLIWSKTKREIAATFGYTQPHHPYRVAVFAWPSCEQVLAIPWVVATGDAETQAEDGDMPGRALWAISFPRGPKGMPIYGQPSTVNGLGAVPGTAEGNTPGRSPSRLARQSPPDRGRRLTRTASHMADEPSRPWSSRTEKEGCIVIACSDESIKFQEIWAGDTSGLGETSGVFGGSQILESLHGVDTIGNSKETIR